MGSYPKEVFRKVLHICGVAGVIAWFYALENWRQSVAITLLAIVFLYPVLYLCSFIPGITEFFNARKKGEYGQSFIALFVAYAIVASVCWGFFGQRILGVACFLAWGPGDAAAALIGKKFGAHRIGRKKVKSLEGSLSMFIFSFISVYIVLFISGLYSYPALIMVSLTTAVVTAITELFVLCGYETLFCPVAAMGVLSIFQFIL